MASVLAIDLGGSSGRAILGRVENKTITLKEIHRFDRYMLDKKGHINWDLYKIYREVKKAIVTAHTIDSSFQSIGIDIWGVDFGLISKGNVLRDPYCYRDTYTKDVVEEVSALIDSEELYKLSGLPALEMNTLFQLYRQSEEALKAEKLLMMPDLLNYLLTGIDKSELSIASTTQLLDPYSNNWSDLITEKFGFPSSLFPQIVFPGNILGELQTDLTRELKITAKAVINVASHGAAMLFATLLTNKAPIFSDVRTFWSPEAAKRVTGKELSGKARHGMIHLINSGASALDGTGAVKDSEGNSIMKEFWNMSAEDIKACLDNTKWCRANYEYFRGGGFSSQYVCQGEMPLTMVRVNIIDGVGPTLQIIEGYSWQIDKAIHDALDKRTDQTWPTIWFAPNLNEQDTNVYDVMNLWGSNHCVSVYGHVGSDFITLASMLRIPVSLHNVSVGRIFRPHAFSGFGTKDLEAADYQACQYYGPIYR